MGDKVTKKQQKQCLDNKIEQQHWISKSYFKGFNINLENMLPIMSLQMKDAWKIQHFMILFEKNYNMASCIAHAQEVWGESDKD